jgi:hypothetical protein
VLEHRQLRELEHCNARIDWLAELSRLLIALNDDQLLVDDDATAPARAGLPLVEPCIRDVHRRNISVAPYIFHALAKHTIGCKLPEVLFERRRRQRTPPRVGCNVRLHPCFLGELEHTMNASKLDTQLERVGQHPIVHDEVNARLQVGHQLATGRKSAAHRVLDEVVLVL